MITFWNRKEVYMGYSMAECSEIRSTLAVNHVKYAYKVVNPFANHGRGTRGSFVERSDLSHMYYVYVHQKDYEWACKLIRDSKYKE